MLFLPPDRSAPANAVPDWPALYAERAERCRDPALTAFYRRGIAAGDTPLSQVPLVALDFETTGLDPQRDGIVSIGLVPFSLARIHASQARHWMVKPRSTLDERSVVVHGITHADLAAAPDLNQLLDQLLAQLAGRVVVVHHRQIERRFLDQALQVRRGEGVRFAVIDTMELEARWHRRRPPGLWQRLLGQQPVSIRLVDSRARYRLPAYRQHCAVTDALATAELLLAQVACHFSPETPLAELWR